MAIPELGVFLPYGTLNGPDESDEDLFERMLEQAVIADQLGYSHIWIPEHHFVKAFQAPSPTMLAVQIGSKVNCTVGTMCSIIPFRHPLTIAGEIALADKLLHGRFEAGLAAGNYNHEFKAMELDRDARGEITREGIDIIIEGLQNREGFSFHGKHFSFDDVTVLPTPYESERPELWIAADSQASVEHAASLGLNVATWPVTRPDSVVKEKLDWFRGAARPGVKQRFATLRQTFVTGSDAGRQMAGEVLLQNNRINRALHHRAADVIKGGGYVHPEPLDNEPSIDELTENLLVGDGAYCKDRLEAYADMGVDHVMTYHAIGVSHEDAIASMTRLPKGGF